MQADLTIHQLGSGSSGNATVVVGPTGALLVDAGFSAKELLGRAAYAHVAADAIRGIVITHGHNDHARGAAVLARKLRVPVWGTPPTLASLANLHGGEDLRPLTPGESFSIAGLAVETLPVPHDAQGTVIVRVEGRFAIATDLGRAGPEVRRFLGGLTGLVLEFNHDRAMLLDGPYPPWLKERILSDRGHLSNAQAAELLGDEGFRLPGVLWLAHLSRHNNTAPLALAAARQVVDDERVRVLVASQHAPTPGVAI